MLSTPPQEPVDEATAPSVAIIQAQASPQTTGAVKMTQKPTNGSKGNESTTIQYHPVTAEGAKAFFEGIAQSNQKALERNLPPAGVTLPPAPVPQITPQEIQQAQETDAFNRKENAFLQQLQKMDDVELATRVSQAKQHPMFAMFEQDVIQPEHDDCPELIYFGEDPIQDLCEFYMYLDAQGCDKSQQTSILKDIQQPPPPDLDTPNDCEVESTQLDPQTDREQSPVANQTDAGMPPAELASKASAPTSPVPGKLLPDNQLGDSSVFPGPSPTPSMCPLPSPTAVVPATIPSAPVTTVMPQQSPAEKELFKPVTAEGMKAFWAVMRRKSTDSLASPLPSSPATSPAVATTSPVPAPVATSPAPLHAPSAPERPLPPPSVPEQPLPAPSVPEQPAAAAKAAATAAAPPASSTSPSPPVAPVPSTGHAAPDDPASPAEPTADQIKEARATYMRFYRSVRSVKAPVEVTQILGYNFKRVVSPPHFAKHKRSLL